MFCSTCGAALPNGLSYCNRCGAKAALSTSPLENARPRENKLAEMVYAQLALSGIVFLGSFIFIYALVEKMLLRGANTSAIVIFIILSLSAVFGVSALLIRQLSRTLGVYLGTNAEQKRQQLDETPAPSLLEAPREPVSSVTEHTTRAFEPSYKK